MKALITQIPVVGKVIQRTYWLVRKKISGSGQFRSSGDYWQGRYIFGGNSGAGSYGKLAGFKASYLNDFVSKHAISSIMEFGCGDGNQLTLAKYPNYVGFDVSDVAIAKCREIFALDKTKKFLRMQEYQDERSSLTLSLDVIYHLVEDETFEEYMRILFGSSNRFVIIYSSDFERVQSKEAPHVRHRHFTNWIKVEFPEWDLLEHIPNLFPQRSDGTEGSFADFFVYSSRKLST